MASVPDNMNYQHQVSLSLFIPSLYIIISFQTKASLLPCLSFPQSPTGAIIFNFSLKQYNTKKQTKYLFEFLGRLLLLQFSPKITSFFKEIFIVTYCRHSLDTLFCLTIFPSVYLFNCQYVYMAVTLFV